MIILLKNGQLVLEDKIINDSIYLDGQKIMAVGDNGTIKPDKVIDLDGLYVLPGFIDPHTHMALQQSEKFRAADDFYTGTVAAAMGGTTTIIDHIGFGPKDCNLHYMVDKYKTIAKDAVVDYSLHGVIQRVDQSILEELKNMIEKEGVISFKAYTTYGFKTEDAGLFQLLQAVKAAGGVLTVHCENDAIIAHLNCNFEKNGQISPRYYPLSRPNEMESETVCRLLNWAHLAGDAPLYIVHTSTKESMYMIENARRRGQKNIFVETCPQYLLLTKAVYQADDKKKATEFIMAPPLRDKADVDYLWQALLKGDIQVVATDHCPFMKSEKHLAEIDYKLAPGGVAGVQERGLLMYDQAVIKRGMSLVDFAKITSTNAAKIFGIYPQKGVIKQGADGDLVVIDPASKTTYNRQMLVSNADYSIYENIEVSGRIKYVFSKGQCIISEGVFKGRKGQGDFLLRKPQCKKNIETLKGI